MSTMQIAIYQGDVCLTFYEIFKSGYIVYFVFISAACEHSSSSESSLTLAVISYYNLNHSSRGVNGISLWL